jgi:type IV pilus assembly protein PilY1
MTFFKYHTLMNRGNPVKYTKILLMSALVTFSAGTRADDIDIYAGTFVFKPAVGESPSDVNPNLMFILDNSGSMNNFILLPVVGTGSATYDSTVDYGEDGNAEDDSYLYLYDDDMDYQNRFVTDQQNKCQAQRDWVAANPNNPIFFDQAVQWLPNSKGKWKWDDDWETSTDDGRVIECADDRGAHALTASTTSWPKNCNNRCKSSTPNYVNREPENKRNPYRRAPNRNLVTGNYHDFLVARAAALGTVSSGTDVSDCNSEDGILIDNDGEVVGQCKSRLEVMKQALSKALDSFNDVNISLMDFNTNRFGYPGSGHGGTVIKAFGDINDADFKADFKAVLGGMSSRGNTPLAEALYEGFNVFSGNERIYGHVRDDNDAHASRDANNVATYKSPIVNECQSNNIVLLSDGEPTADQHADTAISALLGAGNSCSFGSNYINSTNASCLDDLAGYMAKADLSTGTNGVRGTNSVNTYTIGFNVDNVVLEEAANAGRPPGAALGSGYFRANDGLALENVFRRIFGKIQSVDADTFVAPAVTVNAYNRLQNREDIYYVVFKPNINARWNGNLKKYKVTSEAVIADKNGNDAISEVTGFFKDEAQSFWSDEADGASVTAGGMGEKLDINRALYGNLDTATSTVTELSSSGDAVASASRFVQKVVTDGAIDIGVDTSLNAADQLIHAGKIAAWTLGRDIDDEDGSGNNQPTGFVGDNIHGQPYVLSYGPSRADPQDIIFFTSNQGMLHAVTGDDRGGVPGGSEAWAYVPDPSLFKNFGEYYNREVDKVYGLDAEMTFDVRRSSTTNSVTNAVLYFGQRRGGNKVFAVDVTNATSAINPVSKVWTIEGGTGDFSRMGQTWAEPVVAKIRYCSAAGDTDCPLKDVIILSGGYDNAYDDADDTAASLSGAVVGNAVYIVDAANGDLLWMASNNVNNTARDLTIPEMKHSIPAKPTVLDVNKDGAVDIMFLTDISGQAFRIDFKATPTDDNSVFAGNNLGKVAGGLIANMAESGADRRFYNPLDAVLLPAIRGGAPARYAFVTGSGYRANPLATESFGNRISVLFDYNIFEPAYDEYVDPSADGDTDNEAYYLYAENSVGNRAVITMNEGSQRLGAVFPTPIVTDGAESYVDTSGAHKYGFYAEVTGVGEKVITPTLISDFRAIAVAYLPDSGADLAESCAGGVGRSNVYTLNLITGGSEKTELTKPGLTAEPVVVYVPEPPGPNPDPNPDPNGGDDSLKPIVIIGTEPFKGEKFGLTSLKLGKAEKRAWWERGRAN